MSMTYTTSFHAKELEQFLLSEHAQDTGIPVHPFSVVRSECKSYKRSLGITDGSGTLFVGDCEMTAFGSNNNHNNMIRALRVCGAEIDFVW